MSDNDKTNDNNKKTSTDASPTEDQAFVETFEDPIKLYLREITDHPLLSFEQEFRLGIAVQAEELAKAIEDDTHSLLLSALLKNMPSNWQNILDDCKRLKLKAPNIHELLKEARKFSDGISSSEPSYMLSILDTPRWRNKDRLWDIFAWDLIRFFQDLYLLGNQNLDTLIQLVPSYKHQNDFINQLTPEVLDSDLHQTRQTVRENAKRARNILVEYNLRLVVSVAKHFSNPGVTPLDLIQEGNIGLIEAIQRYDPSKGYRFSTYATWWIRQGVSRYIADHARTIRIPVHVAEAITRLNRIQKDLIQRLGRDPNFSEIAAHSEYLSDEDKNAIAAISFNRDQAEEGLLHRWDEATRKVEGILKNRDVPLSLESPIGDSEDGILADYIPDYDAEEPIDGVMQANLKDSVKASLETLNEREKQVLELRFGLVDGTIHTLDEVATQLGLTRERIRQIEAIGLRKLRYQHGNNVLRDFIED